MNPITLAKGSGLFPSRKFSLSETPQLTDQVAVITGGQAGIGEEIVAQLLIHGIAKVYVLARTQQKFVDAKKAWAQRQSLDVQDVDNRTEFVQCDLSDLKVTAEAAKKLIQKLDRLDILFCNAANPPQSTYTLSVDGVDNIFATNHLSHYALTNMLLPVIERTWYTFETACHIVVSSSSLHMLCNELSLDSLTSTTPPKKPAVYDGWWRYGRSKLANILFTKYLAKLESDKGYKVYPNCFFPGNIPTDAMDTWKDMVGNFAGSIPKKIFSVIGQSLEEGATTAMYLAASKELEERDIMGDYFVPIAMEGEPSKLAQDKDLMNNLWYWSDHKVTEVLGKDWQDFAKQTAGIAASGQT
ncbi:putative short chain dehydrogenase/reductase [Rhizodiscina lignyota]|uniref:Short chain dehydrogenase/reductase n=1 Tax=Rhizodiscina lignyota TaxID=1504668 RepID=A0A9P4IG78_9PEZI|nr:putative short chain dehydrogenase/reductase [Rhizodiscina lignyota]